jgi:hypothetical protein
MSTFDQLLGKLSELIGGERAPVNAMAGARQVAERLDPQVTYRASMLPVGNYDDGSVGMVWPQSAVDAKNAFGRFHRGEAPQPQDAVLAGLAMTGAGAFGLGRSAVSRGSVAGAERAEASSGLPSSPVGAGSNPPFRAYHGTGANIEKFSGDHVWVAKDPNYANHYADAALRLDKPANVMPVDVHANKIFKGDEFGDIHRQTAEARAAGYDAIDWGEGTYQVLNPGVIKSATTGETLFSNPPDAAPAGLLATGEGEHHSREQPRNPSGRFVTPDSFDGRLSKFQKLIDTDGDGVPDTPVPTNAMAAMRGIR